MAYMDKPWINCDAMAWHEQCNCTDTWLHQANVSCMAGGVSLPDFLLSAAMVYFFYTHGL